MSILKSKAQIIATIGPSCSAVPVLSEMISHQMDVGRLNLSWGGFDEHTRYIEAIREAGKIAGRKILILLDLPGPRIQTGGIHTYDKEATSVLTDEDKKCIQFAVDQKVDYIALSFVGDEKDVLECRDVIKKCGGRQPVVSKIERKKALQNLDSIVSISDALMVARGDLGGEIPLEQIPFAQAEIIQKAKTAGKPSITATQMLISMMDKVTPTRADVTDVANAILQGSDAVMLSEETAVGKFPIEVITMMEKIVVEAEKHMKGILHVNPL
ncbi:MAG: pyruvate kinase [Candidatus Taylorbacteria bacterium]